MSRRLTSTSRRWTSSAGRTTFWRTSRSSNGQDRQTGLGGHLIGGAVTGGLCGTQSIHSQVGKALAGLALDSAIAPIAADSTVAYTDLRRRTLITAPPGEPAGGWAARRHCGLDAHEERPARRLMQRPGVA